MLVICLQSKRKTSISRSVKGVSPCCVITIFDSGKYEEYSYRIEEKVVRMCACASDLYEWEVADTAMHMEIISIFENERIKKIYENNMSELIRIGQYSVKNGMHIPKTNDNLKKMVNDYESTLLNNILNN